MNHSIRRRLAMAMLGAAVLGCLEAATRLWTGAAPRPEVRILPSAVVGPAGAEEGETITFTTAGGLCPRVLPTEAPYIMKAGDTLTVEWAGGSEVNGGFAFYAVSVTSGSSFATTVDSVLSLSSRQASFTLLQPTTYTLNVRPIADPTCCQCDGFPISLTVLPPEGYVPTPTPTPVAVPGQLPDLFPIYSDTPEAWISLDERMAWVSPVGITNNGTVPLIIYGPAESNRESWFRIRLSDEDKQLFPIRMCPGELLFLAPQIEVLDWEEAAFQSTNAFFLDVRLALYNNSPGIANDSPRGMYAQFRWEVNLVPKQSSAPPSPTPAPPWICNPVGCDQVIDAADVLYCPEAAPRLLGIGSPLDRRRAAGSHGF
ncbi:MAG: hypothetical protein SF028_04100 [Candidatus Sumerlaeia bacterium]|nr:hypothetical protein [Candidatus Sumerlaeia bacterium]